MAIPVLIDTDPGVDDALALLLAGASPEIEVVGITTVAGNVGLERATENARRIVPLAWEGRAAPPIYRGATGGDETAEEVHGIDGIGGAGQHTGPEGRPLYPVEAPLEPSSGAEAILAAARDYPGSLTLVTLGPLTNLAEALERDPDTLRRVREVVIMGGVFSEPGNTGPVAEFNIFVDPEAAQVVCNSGLPLRWVPLDVTHRCRLLREHLDLLPDTRRTRFMRDALEWYMRYHHEGFGEWAAFLHDPVAVGVVLWPELFTSRAMRVDVETAGRFTRGMTVADFRPRPHQHQVRPPNAEVTLEVDARQFVQRFLHRLGALR